VVEAAMSWEIVLSIVLGIVLPIILVRYLEQILFFCAMVTAFTVCGALPIGIIITVFELSLSVELVSFLATLLVVGSGIMTYYVIEDDNDD